MLNVECALLGNQLRVETARPIAWHLDLDPTAVGRHRLAATAIAVVADLVIVPEMMIHLRVEGPFGKSLLQGIEQAA